MRNVALALCLFTSCAYGQSFTGSIRGTVTDTTQASVPNAKVTAIDADRKLEYTTLADAAGRYIFPSLPTANYSLTVESPGFKKATRPAVRLEVQQQATVDIQLSVGELTG